MDSAVLTPQNLSWLHTNKLTLPLATLLGSVTASVRLSADGQQHPYSTDTDVLLPLRPGSQQTLK